MILSNRIPKNCHKESAWKTKISNFKLFFLAFCNLFLLEKLSWNIRQKSLWNWCKKLCCKIIVYIWYTQKSYKNVGSGKYSGHGFISIVWKIIREIGSCKYFMKNVILRFVQEFHLTKARHKMEKVEKLWRHSWIFVW